MGLPSLYFNGPQANITDPNKTQHYVALYLGLNRLTKYPFSMFRGGLMMAIMSFQITGEQSSTLVLQLHQFTTYMSSLRAAGKSMLRLLGITCQNIWTLSLVALRAFASIANTMICWVPYLILTTATMELKYHRQWMCL